ncbi:hypothetical protein HUG17_2321 [Dermatophagoides farinae]|uniref:Uncharacterized protein n=1 Tax=Dermatophagoides farinae TaxID=6954 RepID=A0A9D4PAG0_DERFA|nr:hypothetical protein HUG17_2321 [Dermatophagoides farinae]
MKLFIKPKASRSMNVYPFIKIALSAINYYSCFLSMIMSIILIDFFAFKKNHTKHRIKIARNFE